MRKCHLNTCPVGIATQDPELRSRFNGDAAHVVNFFQYLTEELREIMAELGFRTVDEMVGQVQFLESRTELDNSSANTDMANRHWKYKNLDLSPILYKESPIRVNGVQTQQTLYCSEYQEHALQDGLDWKLLEKARASFMDAAPVYAAFLIKNTDRATGTLLSNEITKLYRAEGLPKDTIHYKFIGTAGQSFGAFAVRGLRFELEGDANDYFGKGLSGACLAIYPPITAGFIPEENSIIGNVAFYGATSGEAYIRGKAGERFCVRNSGAKVVVEGIGDHGCEYMTGGCVVVLGPCGRNFGAGMSGGLAYIWDIQKHFREHYNAEMIDLDPLDEQDEAQLLNMLQQHHDMTQSSIAHFILSDFDNQINNFIKVFPKDYKKVMMKNEGQISKSNIKKP